MKILITGAAKRVGRLLSLELADKGHKIIIHCNSSTAEAHELLEELNGEGHCVINKDLSNLQCTESIFAELKEKNQLPHMLINNASTFYKRGLEEFSVAEMLEDYNINFFSPLLLMRDFKNICGTGKIINILDRRVNFVEPECGPYLFAKKSLRDATEAAAKEWTEIQVNAVAPGPVLLPGHKIDGDVNDGLKWVAHEVLRFTENNINGEISVQKN